MRIVETMGDAAGRQQKFLGSHHSIAGKLQRRSVNKDESWEIKES
jgi:hypothetical protein